MRSGNSGQRGIDGWLLLFLAGCVAIALFHLIELGRYELAVGWFEQDRGESWPLLLRIDAWAFALARIAIPLVIAWRMIVARRWRTIVFAIAAIWLLFLGVPLLDLAIAVARFGWAMVAANLAPLVHGSWPGIVVALGATLYLLGSRRVAATYPVLGEVDRVFD